MEHKRKKLYDVIDPEGHINTYPYDCPLSERNKCHSSVSYCK